MTPEDEWLFIIENNKNTFNITEIIDRVEEGENLCFVYKVSKSQNCNVSRYKKFYFNFCFNIITKLFFN